MDVTENKLLTNILRTGIISVVSCFVLFFCSYLFLGKIQLDAFSLSGTLITILVTFLICALCLWSYRMMDVLKPEPWINVISAFFAGLLIQFALGKLFNRLLLDSVFSSASFRWLRIVKDSFVAGVSFYGAFCLFVGRFQEFDEETDTLIYGGIAGTGVAAAICLVNFFSIGSLNLQFVVVSLVTKIAMCAAAGALSAFLTAKSNKHWQIALSSLCISAFYSAETFIHILLRKSLAVSQHIIQEILVPIAFVMITFSFIVYMIFKMVRSEKDQVISGTTAYILPLKKFVLPFVILLVLSFCSTVLIQVDSGRSVAITSADSKISLKIPAVFEKSKKNISLEALVEPEKASPSKVIYVKKRSEHLDAIQMIIDFAPFVPDDFGLQELPFSPQKGCHIYELPKRPPLNPNAKPASEGNEIKFDRKVIEKNQGYTVLLKKGNLFVTLEFISSPRNKRYIDKVTKVVAKSLASEMSDGE